MAFAPGSKGTLLIPSGADGQQHLHIILTEECADGLHLLVPVSSIRKDKFYDSTCVIDAGEHPFITRKSWVIYRRLLTVRAPHIIKCVKGSLFTPKDEISDDLYERVCDGIFESEFSARGMKDYFEDNS